MIRKIFSFSFLFLFFSSLYFVGSANVFASGPDFFSGYVQLSPASISSGQSTTIILESSQEIMGGSYESSCPEGKGLYTKRPPQTLILDNIVINGQSYGVGSGFSQVQEGFAGGCESYNSSYWPNYYRLSKDINISGLAPGVYPVHFVGRSGPISETDTRYESYDVTPLNLTVTDNPTSGTICVTSNVSTSYTLSGAGSYSSVVGSNSSDCRSAPTGTYTTNGATLGGYTGPSYNQQTQTLSNGGTITFTLTYTAVGGTCQDNNANNFGQSLPCQYGLVNLDFYVRDQNNSLISGATVAINQNFGNGTTRTTSAGYANFGVNSNTSVSYSVVKSDCGTKTGTVNSGNGTTVNVSMSCDGPVITNYCTDSNATNYGGLAPCQYGPSYVTVTITTSGSGVLNNNGSSVSIGPYREQTTSFGVPSGTYIALSASPDVGATFSGWGGACSGTGSCSGAITSNTSVSASFTGSQAGSQAANITFNITYIPATFDYSLGNGGSVSVTKGNSVAYGQGSVVKSLQAGTGQIVDLSVSGLPQGVSSSIANRTCAPTCTSTITLGVDPNTTTGTYPVTITGSPLGKQTSFNLVVSDPSSSGISVTCAVNPSTALLNQLVTWSASVTGGTPPYSYSWAGSGLPTPAPSTNPFTLNYSTIGPKTAVLTVTDADSAQGTCAPTAITEIYFDPLFEEF